MRFAGIIALSLFLVAAANLVQIQTAISSDVSTDPKQVGSQPGVGHNQSSSWMEHSDGGE